MTLKEFVEKKGLVFFDAARKALRLSEEEAKRQVVDLLKGPEFVVVFQGKNNPVLVATREKWEQILERLWAELSSEITKRPN